MKKKKITQKTTLKKRSKSEDQETGNTNLRP